MLRQVLSAALLVIAFACFSACQRVDVEVQPVTLSGEWRLTAVWGGITGQMSTTSPSHDHRLVFGPDSSYAKYYNGKLLEANIYHLRQEPSHAGGPQVQVVLFKTINNSNGQSIYARYYVTTLSATSLETTTGGGCAINQVYERVKKETSSRCIVPESSGVVFTTEFRQHLWDKYFTAAPGQLRQYGALSNKVRKAYKA